METTENLDYLKNGKYEKDIEEAKSNIIKDYENGKISMKIKDSLLKDIDDGIEDVKVYINKVSKV